MMRIDILCVGKIKEEGIRLAIAEYEKRLKAYASLNVIEVKDEKTPDCCSERERELIIQAEAQRIEKYIDKDAYVAALAINGKMYDSEGFADIFEKNAVSSVSKMQFIIGGSLGLDQDILKGADALISFSRMTFPHQLMRLILLEQIYRAWKIIKKEPYHK